MIAAGVLLSAVTSHPAVVRDNVLGVRVLVAAVVAVFGVMCAGKAYIDSSIVPHLPPSAAAHGGGSSGKRKRRKKKGGGSGEDGGALALVRSSERIRDLALIVAMYGVTNKLIGFVW